jgi:glycogen debranching enzyme
MKDVVVIDDRYYILAPSPRVDEHSRVLKHGDAFAVFHRSGDIRSRGLGEEGIYCHGTRHLSRLQLVLDGGEPLLLSSTVRDDNALLGVDLTNSDLARGGTMVLPRDTLHLFRCAVLWRHACYLRFRLRSYGDRRIELPLTLRFAADFRDIFEIRGQRRERRGRLLEPTVDDRSVVIAYGGLDGIERRTSIVFDDAPARLTSSEAELTIALDPGEEVSLSLVVHCSEESSRRSLRFDKAIEAVQAEVTRARERDAGIRSRNEQLDRWVSRSLADVHLMVTDTEHGPYPYAGIPWYSTPFGRDAIITALEFLWINPELARGVLEYLASTQATEIDPDKDAEPGKILHEARSGEMANLGEIPFGQYYGTVDATPLFVVLAGAYYRRTADLDFIAALWPSIEAALGWIDEYGDGDGDGFVEYARRSRTGLVSQGWKDSFDSIFHADGSLADGPIALCEVQAYVYGARRAAAALASALGDPSRAEILERQAEELRIRFEEAFWSEELGTYVLALDGDKRPCRVRSSNAGHCLFTGIAAADRAARVATTLLDESSYSGWGIRTVPLGEARYNPMSYHNGSVWPHDNALIAAGLARYGLTTPVLRIMTGLFDASAHVDLQRMPELFCGFSRRAGEGPTLYPVACSPQAWAAGSVFLLLASCIGLRIDAPARRIELFRPSLPAWLPGLEITGLRVADCSVDLELNRYPDDVGVNLTHRKGELDVVVIK